MHGADLEANNKDGFAPLHFAAQDGHLFIVEVEVYRDLIVLHERTSG